MKPWIASIKMPHKYYRETKHKYHDVESVLDNSAEAYFGPDGQCHLKIMMDDRLYHISFSEFDSKRLAKRLCVDTLDRAYKLLGKKPPPKEEVFTELLATAKELYERLEAKLGKNADLDPELIVCRKAIARAEGGEK